MCMLVLGTGITAQASTMKAEASRFAAASVPTKSVNDDELDEYKRNLLEQLEHVKNILKKIEEDYWTLQHTGDDIDLKKAFFTTDIRFYFNGRYGQIEDNIASLPASIEAAQTKKDIDELNLQINVVEAAVYTLMDLVHSLQDDLQTCLTQFDADFDLYWAVDPGTYAEGFLDIVSGSEDPLYVAMVKGQKDACWDLIGVLIDYLRHAVDQTLIASFSSEEPGFSTLYNAYVAAVEAYMPLAQRKHNCYSNMEELQRRITNMETVLTEAGVDRSESVWNRVTNLKDAFNYFMARLDGANSSSGLEDSEESIRALQDQVQNLQMYVEIFIDNWMDQPIVFADADVELICVYALGVDENNDHKLSRKEAALVTNLGTHFRNGNDFDSFDELQYFTSLTSIPDYAFENCVSLTTITLPNSVTTIGANAFYGCSQLQTLKMSSKVESIGNQAFGNINSAQVNLTIDCAPSHPVIADNLFCNYEYIFSAIKSVKLESGITSIGLHAFDYCTGMNSITIPSTVTSIGGSAFQNCESLTSVNIPRGVTTIGEGLFYNCRSLTETVIPEGVTSIWAGAFGNCSALESITIPSTVTSIGQSQWGNSSAGYTFSGCTSLGTIRVDAVDPPELANTNVFDEDTYANAELVVSANSTAAYAAAEGWSKFTHQTLSYDYVDEQGVVYRYDVTEDGKATVIGYRGSAVTVSIPESITVGGITYPVTIIAEGAFQYSSMKILNLTTNVWFIYKYAFVDYEHEEDTPTINITVSPTSTNTILGGTNEYGLIPLFSHAYGIHWVNIGEGITKIASSAFNGTKVKGVTVPSTVTVIDEWAFYNSPMLEQVILNEGLQTIGTAAFLDCVKLSYVNIPKTVTLIGNSAFRNCTALTGITIPSGVTALNTEVFAGCTNLRYVTIPTTVRTIAEDAFYNNGSEIDYMTITPTETETTIASRLFKFEGGFNFKRLILQEGITEIGDFAFWSGNLLEQVNLPESLQKIGEYAFQGCSELKNTLFIPKSVTSIGAGAFDGCQGLRTMQVYWNTPLPVSGDPFPTRNNITLTIPFGALEAYLADDYWKDFIFEESDFYIDENGLTYYPDKTTHTAEVAFNKGKVVEADIVESFTAGGQTYQVTSISGSAWIWDLGLIAVTIPKTVTTINDQAFNSCANLNTITVYATTPPTLGSQVFDNQASGRDIHENACLYVPKGTVEAYRTAWGFTHVYEIVSGDANGDGVVTIADAMAIVNYILGQPLDGFVEANADVNGDGKITIADAVNLVNMILN